MGPKDLNVMTEDWNAMPGWMKAMMVELVFVGSYVQVKYPEVYAEAKEAYDATR